VIRPLGKNAVMYVTYLLFSLSLLTACTATMVAQDPLTPTPEVFIPRTAVVPAGATVSGRVLWGAKPVAGAQVELRTGAWADPTASETIAQTVADANGRYELEAPPNGGEFGLVAVWSDGSANTAPVTPVQVAADDKRVEANVYLAQELAWLEHASASGVSATPMLRWSGMPGVSQYRLWVIDAGTTELVFDLTITAGADAEQRVILPPLTPGRTYTWDVQGLDVDGNLLARRTGEFKVAPQPATPTSEPIPAQIVRLDRTWYQYTNYQLGFSIKFPKALVSLYGSCKWTEENGDHSYRPEPSSVPVKIFEDGDTAYIAGEVYYELTGETKETSADGATRTFFSDCQAVTNNLELLRNPDNYYQTKWKIVVSEIHDDDELDAFIKSRYGSGCNLGEKVASGQDGVYDIRIQGDGKDLSETLCPLNYLTVVKYYPEANKVVAWDLGQAPTFAADVAYSRIYDQEMVDSFRFLTETPTVDATGPGQPMPPISNDLAYSRIRIAETGLSMEIPGGWLRLEPEWVWIPVEGSSLHLGVKWADLQPPQEAEAVLLPQPAQVIDSQEIALNWGSGRSFTVEVYAPAAAGGEARAPVQSVERHAIVVIEMNGTRRAFDLYAVAPAQEELTALEPLLQHILDTSSCP
jgi:hypothetical protein